MHCEGDGLRGCFAGVDIDIPARPPYVFGFAGLRRRPVVHRPNDTKTIRIHDAQRAALHHGGDWARGLKNFQAAVERAILGLHGVALLDDGDTVVDLSVHNGAQQLDVFRMRPHQRLRRTCGLAEVHALRRQIGEVPHLFGEHASDRTERLDRMDVRLYVSTRGKLVMRALAGEDRPRPALAGAGEWAAIFALAVAIVVVAAPARAVRRVSFQHGIDHL